MFDLDWICVVPILHASFNLPTKLYQRLALQIRYRTITQRLSFLRVRRSCTLEAVGRSQSNINLFPNNKMRPFPPRTVQGTVPIVTPYFIGFRRGIDGNPIVLNRERNTTSVEQIKCLRAPIMNAIPLVPIHERYRCASASFSKSALPPRKPYIPPQAEFKRIRSSTYSI